jgi:hypothetical protein
VGGRLHTPVQVNYLVGIFSTWTFSSGGKLRFGIGYPQLAFLHQCPCALPSSLSFWMCECMRCRQAALREAAEAELESKILDEKVGSP